MCKKFYFQYLLKKFLFALYTFYVLLLIVWYIYNNKLYMYYIVLLLLLIYYIVNVGIYNKAYVYCIEMKILIFRMFSNMSKLAKIS